ncbi:hypothetical protein GNZ12_26820 [Paraburkholderia sp. 1N]|uniref:PD(D/E)XK endonuclease domain-containing protein n=1 Tax=Paraburkholderia solitsugae TaxID=2675748 RepID=A0ABX2BYJ4_9BURK|nr:hypothetical protein [Paraburkholderia solitsugae]NPT44865.1 hypothetical protein [Paraburkholderia solitsugae]
MTTEKDKSFRGNASQFFVAGELCRRGYAAVVTLGNTPNTDVLCSNRAGTKFVHVQVKTFVPGTVTCNVGLKAERAFGPNFFWILAGIPPADSAERFRYFIVPSADMAANVASTHVKWLATPGKGGRAHRDNPVRAVSIPPLTRPYHWSVEGYEDRWDLIDTALTGDPAIALMEAGWNPQSALAADAEH